MISEWIGLSEIAPSDDDVSFVERGMFMKTMVILDDDTGEAVETSEMVIEHVHRL